MDSFAWTFQKDLQVLLLIEQLPTNMFECSWGDKHKIFERLYAVTQDKTRFPTAFNGLTLNHLIRHLEYQVDKYRKGKQKQPAGASVEQWAEYTRLLETLASAERPPAKKRRKPEPPPSLRRFPRQVLAVRCLSRKMMIHLMTLSSWFPRTSALLQQRQGQLMHRRSSQYRRRPPQVQQLRPLRLLQLHLLHLWLKTQWLWFRGAVRQLPLLRRGQVSAQRDLQ